MKKKNILRTISDKRKDIMEDETILLPSYAQGFTDALDWLVWELKNNGD